MFHKWKVDYSAGQWLKTGISSISKCSRIRKIWKFRVLEERMLISFITWFLDITNIVKKKVDNRNNSQENITCYADRLIAFCIDSVHLCYVRLSENMCTMIAT